ncbi:hypothetical protein BH23ACT9_BH23ACT9_12250 [soil metagenome]
MTRLRSHAGAALLLVAVLAVGCESEPAAIDGDVDGDPGEVASELLGPLTGLGPCPQLDLVPVDVSDVAGLVLPDGAIATSSVSVGPLTTVEGWIPQTPVQIRVGYANDPDLRVIQLEDEIRESESLLSDGTNRLFVKAQAICESASRFLAVVGPDEDGAVPVPAGVPGG